MYKIKVIWLGRTLGDSSVEDFENWFLDEYNFHVKYETEFEFENNYFENKLSCIIFGICAKEISEFAIFRIKNYGEEMKWLDDFLNDKQSDNVKDEILEYLECDDK